MNTSLVHGAVSDAFAKQIGGTDNTMWATGISLIIHPRNPRVPTSHANFRMIQAGDKYWFGGGADLTPYYPHVEDFQYFHDIWKNACEPYGHYDKWKKLVMNISSISTEIMRCVGLVEFSMITIIREILKSITICSQIFLSHLLKAIFRFSKKKR